jgi:hypothetical protein
MKFSRIIEQNVNIGNHVTGEGKNDPELNIAGRGTPFGGYSR